MLPCSTWAKETEMGQTLPRGGLVYWPSNRKVGMGESGGETVSDEQTEPCVCRRREQRGDLTSTSLRKHEFLVEVKSFTFFKILGEF